MKPKTAEKDYGNTIEWEGKKLLDHWAEGHKLSGPGGELRPYTCMACRLMAERIGRLYMTPSGRPGLEVAVTYLEVRDRVIATGG